MQSARMHVRYRTFCCSYTFLPRLCTVSVLLVLPVAARAAHFQALGGELKFEFLQDSEQ